MENFEFSKSTQIFVEWCDVLNKAIDELSPWKKNDDLKQQILYFLISQIYKLNQLISPILIDSTKHFFLNINKAIDESFTIKSMTFLFSRLETK